MRAPDDVRPIDRAFLRAHPLPEVGEDDGKDARGRVLVLGGSASTPGAVILAGLAALRAGAGKLQIATARSIAAPVAVAVPEALVVALPEEDSGSLGAIAAARAGELIEDADAALVGPGLVGRGPTARFMDRLLSGPAPPRLVLDAGALYEVAAWPGALRHLAWSALTPNGAELRALADGADGDDDATRARRAAELHATAVAGAGCVAVPGVAVHESRAGGPGLGTSGSGYVRAGIIAGLAARGADQLTALGWGVHLHRVCGDRLALRVAPLGFLARELLDEIAPALGELDG